MALLQQRDDVGVGELRKVAVVRSDGYEWARRRKADDVVVDDDDRSATKRWRRLVAEINPSAALNRA